MQYENEIKLMPQHMVTKDFAIIHVWDYISIINIETDITSVQHPG
jgi:hypothetical protein